MSLKWGLKSDFLSSAAASHHRRYKLETCGAAERVNQAAPLPNGTRTHTQNTQLVTFIHSRLAGRDTKISYFRLCLLVASSSGPSTLEFLIYFSLYKTRNRASFQNNSQHYKYQFYSFLTPILFLLIAPKRRVTRYLRNVLQ